jgi:ribonuclease J
MEENNTPNEQPTEKKEKTVLANKAQSKNGAKKSGGRGRRPQANNQALIAELKKNFERNEKIHKDRLNPHYKLDLDTKAKVKVIPLGGLGEIGGNITVFETEKSAIIVDVGMSFPTDDMHGVDILVPDFSYIEKIKSKIAGIVITHAHEDHIGAVPYLFKKYQFPLYATALALGMIDNKFQEHKLTKFRTLFRPVDKRTIYNIGEFEVEWMHITHSIIDSSALAITTEAGTIIHSGDFKIDHTPIDGYPTDIHRLAYYGEKGVMLLMSDSTNSHNTGFTKSESTVGPTFDQLFMQNKESRVIMSTFSSNIHRVYQAISYGLKYGRKICVIGRSMEKNIENAMSLGYLKLPKNEFIEPHEVAKYNDEEVLIVTTGSQGEPMSALYRMATDEHRHVKLKPTDMIILSAKAIPGNEGSVSRVINFIQKAGAKVAYQDFSEIHVSGHAGQEEQKLMLRLVKPKFFLPVHGEYNHIKKHAETAVKCGVLEKNTLLMSDGDVIEVSPKFMKRGKSVKTGKVFIDNQVNSQIEQDVVHDRQNLAEAGIVNIIAQIAQDDRKLLDTKVITYGLVANRYNKSFNKEIEDIIIHFLTHAKDSVMQNSRAIENELRGVVRKHIFRKMKKYPIIVPTIYVM